jgi:glycerophosphoryl diester phosphodiesterase
MTLVVAHRTCPLDAPENSLAGIRRAAALGADVVELDARRTLDGTPVLLHDPLLARTTFWPLPVRLVPARTVVRARLRRGNGEAVPTLSAALHALPDGLAAAIDVKDAGAMAGVIEVARDADRLDRVLLWAQDEGAVELAVRMTHGVEVALLRDTVGDEQTSAYLADAIRLGATAVSVHEAVLSDRLVAEARARGLRVYCWVRSPDRHAAAVSTGLYGIVTDWPAGARVAVDADPSRR